MRKPESSTPVVPVILSKEQKPRPKLMVVPDDKLARAVTDTNLGRRRVPRRTFESPIGLLAKGEYGIAQSFQVGEGGMMFSCKRKLVVGQMVVISFYLPTSATIVVRGTVRSVIPAKQNIPERFGVEFANLGFQFKREIRNFVASATGVAAG